MFKTSVGNIKYVIEGISRKNKIVSILYLFIKLISAFDVLVN